MNFFNNLRTVLATPSIGLEYVYYNVSRAVNGGQAIRSVSGIKISGFSGFGEYHSCMHFVSPAEYKFLTEYPLADGVIIDVGSNLGLVSLILARRARDRIVHSFEPNPSTYAALCENIALNACTNIRAYEKAVADKDGVLMFDANPTNRGTTSISSEEAPHAKPVSSITLDSFVRENGDGDVAFMKVDVEGYERLVFGGGVNVLGARRCALIYFEVCPVLARRAGFEPDDAAAFLQQNGYVLNSLNSEGRLVPVFAAEAKNVVCDNWIAVRR
jgi:FkbM family methyltransferase